MRDVPKFYLRNFIDRDGLSNDYQQCTFSSQKFFGSTLGQYKNLFLISNDQIIGKYILDKKELKKFNSWNELILYNHAKIKIGCIKTIIE